MGSLKKWLFGPRTVEFTIAEPPSSWEIEDAKQTRLVCVALHHLLSVWVHGYCYTADDGGAMEEALLDHARLIVGLPTANVSEILAHLEKILDM